MIPPATATAPPVMWRSRMSSASEGEQDERSNDRRHNHPPADGALRLRIEFLGFFEERHERNFGTHADKQEQKELRHQCKIDDREIH